MQSYVSCGSNSKVGVHVYSKKTTLLKVLVNAPAVVIANFVREYVEPLNAFFSFFLFLLL
jgi:hypothetical protein